VKQTFALDNILIDKRYQARVKGLDEVHVTDLMNAYGQADAEIEPPRVWIIPAVGNVLTRGFHRLEALKRLGRKRVECEIRNGSIADALTDAASGNNTHGLKRTNADKKRSVEMVVEAHPDWSNRRIADEAGVSHNFVTELRQLSSDDSSNSKTPEKTTGKDGKERPAKKKNNPKKSTSEPVSKSDDDETASRTDEQSVEAEFEAEPESVPEAAKPSEPGIETVEVKGKITSVKGFPEPRILRFKKSNGKMTEKVIDMMGNPIPDHLGDLFVDNTLRDILSQLEAAMEIIESADKQLIKSATSKVFSTQFNWVDWATINIHVKKFRDSAVEVVNAVRDGLPYAACPGCGGDKNGCKECRLCGYWPRVEVENNAKRFRQAKGGAA
jgi:hypothetical protein